MALIKSIDTDFGIPASYWNIGSVQEDFKGKGTEVTFYGYASKEAREAGKQPLSAGKMQIADDEYVAGADRQALYQIIKLRPEFEGAEDA
jgi:rubrerythrin